MQIITKSTGPDFMKFFEVPKNHLKSIAIGQESLFSHLGIIKTPKYLKKTSRKQEKTQMSPTFPIEKQERRRPETRNTKDPGSIQGPATICRDHLGANPWLLLANHERVRP